MPDPEDPDPLQTPYNPLINLFNSRPVLVNEYSLSFFQPSLQSSYKH